MGQAVSGRWIVCLIAVIVLIAVGAVCLVQAEFGDDEQPKGQAVASGSGVTVTQTAQATAAVTAAVNSASAASQQTKVPEKGQATYVPDGIANEIAAVPTLAPQTIPTPMPKIRSKAVALSFDDGPSTVNTPKVLALLKQYQAHATFFVVGHFLESAPEIVKRMVEDGHTVGNHTYHHYDMSKISDPAVFRKEMDDVRTLFQETTGTEMAMYYRPPQGKYSETNLQMAKDLGYSTFFWSLAYVDWNVDAQPSHEEAFSKLTGRIHPGAVVLLHNTSKTNVEILDELLTKWEEMGYTFGKLDELLQ